MKSYIILEPFTGIVVSAILESHSYYLNTRVTSSGRPFMTLTQWKMAFSMYFLNSL